MKHLKTIILYTVCSLTLIACDAALLDRQPYDKLQTTKYYTNKSQIETGVTGLYVILSDSRLFNPTLWDAFSDDAYSRHDYGGSSSVTRSGLTPSSGGFVLNLYSSCYEAIARINHFEEVLMNKASFLSETDKAGYLAECHFLRAYFYFWLARTYGNVPLYIDTKIDEDNPLANSPRDAILAQIHRDLDTAIKVLPDKVFEGHAVKASAQALKMHAYLLSGSFQQALKVYDAFSTVPELSSDWNGIFLETGQKGNKEILFSIGANPPSKGLGPYTWAESIDTYLGSWLDAMPTKFLADAFEQKDGSDRDPKDTLYQNLDPRFYWTMVPAYLTNFLTNPNPQNPKPTDDVRSRNKLKAYTGFMPNKFLHQPYPLEAMNAGFISPQDYVLLRYADVLLMGAEAANEENDISEAYKAINQIRARVGMPDVPQGLTKDQMRERIRRERRVELALENSRYFDLRRWKEGTQPDAKSLAIRTLNGLKKRYPENAQESPGIYKEHYQYWPINQNFLLNNKNLKQNPGY